MSGFTKLFSSIVTSSVWSESNETRIVWVTMMALADRRGIVEAAIPGLANAARVTIPECEDALAKFLQPDSYSRSSANEGRRIEKIEGGWRLLNYEAYRRKLSKEDRADYQRVKQQEYRDGKKGKVVNLPASKGVQQMPAGGVPKMEVKPGLCPDCKCDSELCQCQIAGFTATNAGTNL